MLKDGDVSFVVTSHSFTDKSPRVILARALAEAGEGVRVTENPTIQGSYKIEYSHDGLTAMSRIQALEEYRKLLEHIEDFTDELRQELIVSLARNISTDSTQ